MATESQRHREREGGPFNNHFSHLLCVSVTLWQIICPNVVWPDLASSGVSLRSPDCQMIDQMIDHLVEWKTAELSDIKSLQAHSSGFRILRPNPENQ
jgi:hypothetical protein